MGLFSIIARLTGNTTDFDRKMTGSMNRAQATVGKAAGMIKGQLAAAFGVAAIVALEKRTIEFGSKVKDMSVRLGVSTDAVQELAFAAEQGGASFDTMSSALTRFGKLRGDILAGNGDVVAKKNLARLGISDADLAAGSTVELFKQIGNILAANSGHKDRGAIASTLFGRSGEQLLPVFDSGLEQMANRLRDIGGVIDSEKIAQLKAAGDALTDIKMQMLAIGGEAAPMMKRALEGVVEAIKSMRSASDVAAKYRELKDSGDSSFTGVMAGFFGIGRRTQAASNLVRLENILSGQGRAGADSSGGPPGTIADAMGLAPSSGGGGSGRSFNMGAGSLASIGGFVGLGGSRNAQLSITQKQLDRLEEIVTLLQNDESITLK